MSTIQLRSVTKRFGSHTALSDIDLTTSGTITIDSRDVTGASPRERRVAMVFQSYALYPHLTVAKNIGFPLKARRASRADIEARVRAVAGMTCLPVFVLYVFLQRHIVNAFVRSGLK